MEDSIKHLKESIVALDIDAHNLKPLTEDEKLLLNKSLQECIDELKALIHLKEYKI